MMDVQSGHLMTPKLELAGTFLCMQRHLLLLLLSVAIKLCAELIHCVAVESEEAAVEKAAQQAMHICFYLFVVEPIPNYKWRDNTSRGCIRLGAESVTFLHC